MTSAPSESELRCQYLSGHVVACPGCGYNLHGLTGDRCPECSQEIELAIRLARPRLGHWVAAVSGLAAGAGAAGAIICVLTALSVVTGFDDLLGLCSVPAAWLVPQGSLLALLSTMRGRVWFRARSASAQLAVIAASWLATVAFVIIFTLKVLGT